MKSALPAYAPHLRSPGETLPCGDTALFPSPVLGMWPVLAPALAPVQPAPVPDPNRGCSRTFSQLWLGLLPAPGRDATSPRESRLLPARPGPGGLAGRQGGEVSLGAGWRMACYCEKRKASGEGK